MKVTIYEIEPVEPGEMDRHNCVELATFTAQIGPFRVQRGKLLRKFRSDGRSRGLLVRVADNITIHHAFEARLRAATNAALRELSGRG